MKNIDDLSVHGQLGALSPRRSSVFADAIKSRFHFDDEAPELQEAYNSVNQLTSDVTRGKRLNKNRKFR